MTFITRGIFRILLSLFILEGLLRLGGFVFLMAQSYHNMTKDKDTYLIVCIGDSTTAVGGVNSWPSQLERALNASSPYKKYKTINIARPGITSGIMNDHLDESLDQYQPNMVIALVGAMDGFYNNAVSDNAFSKFKLLVLDQILVYKFIKKMKAQAENGINEMWKERIKKTAKADAAHSDAATVEGIYRQIYNDQVKGSIFEHNRCTLIKYNMLHKNQDELLPLYKSAEKQYQEELRVKPDDVGLQLDLSICAFEQKEYVKVVEILGTITLSQKIPWAYQPLARSYIALGDYRRAEAVLVQSMDLDLSNYWVAIDLGDLYVRQNRLSEAIELYQKAIAQYPLVDRLFFELAKIYERRDELSKAKEYREKGLRLANPHPLTVRNYNEIVSKVLGRDIKLIGMQYPLRKVDTLKRMLSNNENIVFVDNEDVFYKAVRTTSTYEIFLDFANSDIGHWTSFGSRIIAENLTNVILGIDGPP